MSGMDMWEVICETTPERARDTAANLDGRQTESACQDHGTRADLSMTVCAIQPRSAGYTAGDRAAASGTVADPPCDNDYIVCPWLRAPAHRRYGACRISLTYRKRVPSVRQRHMSPVTLFLVLAFIAAAFATGYFANLCLALVLLAAAAVIASSLRMANVWREFAILRLGKLLSVRRAHLFPFSPVADSALAWLRIRCRDGRSRRILVRIAPRRRLAASACLLFGASLLAAYAGVSSQADERAPPRNAHASPDGGGWECSRGFREVEEACAPIRVPVNAHLDSFGNDWDCNRGYMKGDEGLDCKAVKVPANAHANDEEDFGTGWECDRGYREVGGRCTRVVVPANAYYSEFSFGRSWECDPGYRQEGQNCLAMRAPAHGFLVGERDEWACDRGFMKRAASCVPVVVPANGYLDSNGNKWRCERGFRQEGASCVRLVVPAGGYIDYTGNGWTCAEGSHEHDGECSTGDQR